MSEQQRTKDQIVWQPIETAPNDAAILVAYDDKHVELKTAEDNTYDWQPYKGPLRWCISPTHWMPVPEAPRS